MASVANFNQGKCQSESAELTPDMTGEATAKPEANVPVYLLSRLLSTAEPDILLRLAESARTNPKVLAALAYNSLMQVRAAVADNPNVPYPTLLKLARDSSVDVRFQLAENHNIPPPVLLILSQDDNPYVRNRAETTLERLHTDYRLHAG